MTRARAIMEHIINKIRNSSAGPNPKTICSITRNARDCFTMCVYILEIKDLESMLLEFDRLSNA